MAVLSLEITERAPLADGMPFGEVGPYEQIRGVGHFGVDPCHPDHQVITDLDLAAVESDTLVHFASDFLLLKPVRPSADGSLLCDVINRGGRTVLRTFNRAETDREDHQIGVGDGFLLRHGFTIAFCGRQHDVPAGMAVRVPEATYRGKRLRGQTYIQYQLDHPEKALPLADGGHRPVPTADLDDPAATLTVREHPDAPQTTIDRALWHFGRVKDGRVVSDPSYVYLSTGFEPGAVYEIIYTTIGAPIIGLGLLAVRDCVSFLKYGTDAEGNPCAGTIRYALGYGSSQCGRFLREFLYLGLNGDERGRLVFDGVFTHTCKARRGEFNLRFGQPSTNVLRSPGAVFPMGYGSQTDPVTGEADGLLNRLEAKGATPKIIASSPSADYWWSGASLAHTDVGGIRDVEPPPSVRIYHLAGAFPEGTRLRYGIEGIDLRPFLRASLISLDRWAKGLVDPPPSRYPRIVDGTAVSRESLEERFRSLPGARFPLALPQRRRLDFGPEARRGIPHYPPQEGPPYRTSVSAVDADCNEIAGVRLLDVRVPLATYTGWTVRHQNIGGAGHFIPQLGATHPFPATAADRAATGDPRLSIDERYPSRDDYLEKVRVAAEDLVSEGFLLGEDVEHVVARAGDSYDAFRVRDIRETRSSDQRPEDIPRHRAPLPRGNGGRAAEPGHHGKQS